MLQAIGKQLYDGAQLVRLNGVNDSTVLAWQMGDILGQYSAYRYSNHNLPQYPVPGSIDSDKDCKIPSDSWTEFWYKYFWMLKNKLGGYTSAAPPYGYHADVTGNTYLNHLRVGGHDGWGRDLQYKAFTQQRALCDLAMSNMLDMAAENGIYINVTMGGTPPEDSLFGTGDLFTVGTPAYNNYVQYCADYINAYGNHAAIACFNLFNEPINFDSGNAYPDKKSRSPWWVARYNPNWATLGFPLVQDPALSQPYEAWENAAIKWKAALIGDVKSLVTLNPRPLITIGGGQYSIIYTASDAAQTYQRNRAHDYSMNDDLIVGHPYWGAEDDYIIQWWTRGDINKPGYTEEWGYNQTSSGPPWYSWWPWTDLTLRKYGFSNCVMVLRDMPNPTPSGDPYVLPKPPYPGYPLDSVDLADATAAWVEYINGPQPTCRDDHPVPLCIDGEVHDCVDGVWTNTHVSCGAPVNLIPWLMLGGGIFLISLALVRK